LFKLKIGHIEDIRKHVERICIKSEIAFAKRLPDSQKLVEKAESRLQRSENYSWTNAQFQQFNLDSLAELGKKFWPARFLYPILKRRSDKKNARLLSREKK
jgi:hypothetical protein